MPGRIQQVVRDENLRFMHNRDIYNDSYLQFILKLLIANIVSSVFTDLFLSIFIVKNILRNMILWKLKFVLILLITSFAKCISIISKNHHIYICLIIRYMSLGFFPKSLWPYCNLRVVGGTGSNKHCSSISFYEVAIEKYSLEMSNFMDNYSKTILKTSWTICKIELLSLEVTFLTK